MIARVHARLADPDASVGAVMDGFPRTVEQARVLDAALTEIGRTVDAVVSLDVTTEAVVARLGGRRTCGRCGAPYHLQSAPPRAPDLCDRCGGELHRRADDDPGVVRRRLALYATRTAPVIDYYRTRGLLIVVDGGPAPEVVATAIDRSLRQAFTPAPAGTR
jgi:adenylate kinase